MVAKKKKKTLKDAPNKLHQAWAAAPKPPRHVPPDPDDFLPMRFFRNGRARPLGSQCTCEIAPNKYCWVHKGYADPEANKPVGDSKVLWGDLFNGRDQDEIADLWD